MRMVAGDFFLFASKDVAFERVRDERDRVARFSITSEFRRARRVDTRFRRNGAKRR